LTISDPKAYLFNRRVCGKKVLWSWHQDGQAEDGRGFETGRTIAGSDEVALVEVVHHVDLPAHVGLAVALEELKTIS
jgi:hypothetical protein